MRLRVFGRIVDGCLDRCLELGLDLVGQDARVPELFAEARQRVVGLLGVELLGRPVLRLLVVL